MAVNSTMLDLGTPLPPFRLSNTNRRVGTAVVSSDDFRDARALLVAFICNHCPYVVHVREAFVRFAEEYGKKGVAVVAISANDPGVYAADGPQQMAEEAERHGFPFPYLYDETQQVAKAYRAACTPDLYLFDGSRKLVYRGQFDGSRPGNKVAVTGSDLRAAADAVLAGRSVPAEQKASIGCSIKWRPGAAPDYAG